MQEEKEKPITAKQKLVADPNFIYTFFEMSRFVWQQPALEAKTAYLPSRVAAELADPSNEQTTKTYLRAAFAAELYDYLTRVGPRSLDAVVSALDADRNPSPMDSALSDLRDCLHLLESLHASFSALEQGVTVPSPQPLRVDVGASAATSPLSLASLTMSPLVPTHSPSPVGSPSLFSSNTAPWDALAARGSGSAASHPY